MKLSSDALTYKKRREYRDSLPNGKERQDATWTLMDGLDDWAGTAEGQEEMDMIDEDAESLEIQK